MPRKMYRKNYKNKNDRRVPKTGKVEWKFIKKRDEPVEQITRETFTSQCSVQIESDKPLPELDDDLFFIGMPEKVVKYASQIPKAKNGQIFSKQNFYINITEIHSPSFFWFIFSESSKDLDNMLDDIHAFYSKEAADIYKISEKRAIIGRACVAMYNYIWHRAVIVKSAKDGFVTVMYFDFGTIRTIPLEDVRFLLQRFAKMPRLIMRGRLALINPLDKHWPRELDNNATERFFDFVYAQRMKATLYAYEKDNDVYHLILYNDWMKPHEKLSINKKLASSELAVIQTVQKEQWPHMDDLYPTFEMLEANDFPTYMQLIESENPDDFWKSEDTAPFYDKDYISKKIQMRIVYGIDDEAFNESSVEELDKVKVDSGLDSSIDNDARTSANTKLKSIRDYHFPAAILEAVTRCKQIDESECERVYWEKLGHLYHKQNVIPIKERKVTNLLKKLRETFK